MTWEELHEGVCQFCKAWKKNITIRYIRMSEDEEAMIRFVCVDCARKWRKHSRDERKRTGSDERVNWEAIELLISDAYAASGTGDGAEGRAEVRRER